MTIGEFIEARLAEDEAAARAAWGKGAWSWRGIGRNLDERPSIADTVHIARHDPARVLREVAAKRAILARYRSATEDFMHVSENESEYGRRAALEDAVEALAAVWSDHPDYDAAWAS